MVVAGFATGDTITIKNYGTIAGGGGYIGSMQQNGSVNTTWAPGNGPNCIGTGYTFTGADGYGYGNYSSTIYWYGPGIGGNWPVYDSYSGGTGAANGGNGGNGGPALVLAAATYASIRIVQQGTSSIFVGGGGGAGGMAGNNRGGGQGGNGGYAIQTSGLSHPDIILYNNNGAIFASGGGGAGGWGNRYEGEGHGGYYGASAIGYFWTGAGASPGGSNGLADNNVGTTIINTAGTFVVSPAQ